MKQLNESIKVANEDLAAYCLVIAEEYTRMPMLDKSVLHKWTDVIKHNEKMLKRILSGVEIIFTTEDPYPNQRMMMYDIMVNKKMKIFKTPSDDSHVGMSAKENDILRAVHDFLGHYKPIESAFKKFMEKNKIKSTGDVAFQKLRFNRNSFTVRGEMNTYISHGKLLPDDLKPVLFTEIVGQISTYFATGDFTDNKVGVIRGVDFKDIGFFTDAKLEKRMARYSELLKDDSVDEIPTKMGKIKKSSLRWNLLSRGTGQIKSKEKAEKELVSDSKKDYNEVIQEGVKMKKQITESSLSRIYSKVDGENIGMLSAFRGDLPLRENKMRSAALVATLNREGFDVTRIIGSYVEQYGTDEAQEVKEESFFVAENENTRGKLLDVLIREGTKYDQDSIFFKPVNKSGYLLGISKRENAFPPYKEMMEVGTPSFGKEGEFFSRVRNRPFTFESASDVQRPSNFFGRWAEKVASERK